MDIDLRKYNLVELNLMAFRTKREAEQHARSIGKGIPFRAANRFNMFWILLESCQSLPGVRMVDMLQENGWLKRAHPGFWGPNGMHIRAEDM